MTKPMHAIHNTETNEIIEIELDAQELAAIQEQSAKNQAARLKAETDKVALLAKLGITADEAKLLLS